MTNKKPIHPFAEEAADLNTTPERLTHLGHDRTLMLIIAANPATPTQVLELLSKEPNPDIRRTLALNPNTPLSLLLSLAQEFPKEFLANPILPLLSLSQPDFIKDIPALTWLHLLRQENIPLAWLTLLRQGVVRLSDNQEDILKAVRSHVSVAGELAETWVMQPETDDTSLLNHIARHPHIPPTILSSLSITSIGTRLSVANNPYTPDLLLHQLAHDKSSSIRRATALHHATSLEDLETLALDPEITVRTAIARNPKLTADLYGLLAGDESSKVRASLARNTRAPEYVLTALAHDHDFLVRCEVAHNPRLPKDVFSVLLHDKENVVRYHLARNSQLPHDMFIPLFKDKALSMHEYLALNQRIPLPILEMLIDTNNKDIFDNIARNSQASPDLLIRLAQNKDLVVCATVAAHKRTPIETLRWLMQNRWHERLPAYLVANPHTPLDILEEILLKDRTGLCFRATNHPAILQSQSPTIFNNLLATIHEGTSHSKDRLSLLKDASLSVALLTAFSNTAYATERCFVALHSKTPLSLLQVLKHDGNRYVRAIAYTMLEHHIKKENI